MSMKSDDNLVSFLNIAKSPTLQNRMFLDTGEVSNKMHFDLTLQKHPKTVLARNVLAEYLEVYIRRHYQAAKSLAFHSKPDKN